MAFRNENLALRTKVQELQKEVETLRAQVTGVEPCVEDRSEPVAPRPVEAPSGADVGSLVAARRAEEAEARRAAELDERRARQERVTALQERPRRVVVEQLTDKTRIHIAAKLLRDALREDAEWHFWFFLINPGVFIVGGLTALLAVVVGLGVPAAIATAVTTWVAVLGLGNIVHSRLANPRHTLDILESGYFALYSGSRSEPILYGSLGELAVGLSDHDPSRLGELRMEDGHSRIDLDKLSPADVSELRSVLGRFQS